MKNGRELWKRGMCCLLSAAMVLGNVPATALAEGNTVVLESDTSEEAQEIIQALTDILGEEQKENGAEDTGELQSDEKDTGVSETAASETSAPETSSPETSGFDTSVPETSAPEEAAPEADGNEDYDSQPSSPSAGEDSPEEVQTQNRETEPETPQEENEVLDTDAGSGVTGETVTGETASSEVCSGQSAAGEMEESEAADQLLLDAESETESLQNTYVQEDLLLAEETEQSDSPQETGTAEYQVTGGSLLIDLEAGAVVGYNGNPTEVRFPATIGNVSVTKIMGNSFTDCESLQSVVVPEGYTLIGENAFNGCAYLTSADIAGSVETVEANAFRGCSRLSSVTLGEGLKSLGTGAFYGCTDLGSIALPDSLESLPGDTFYSCTSLAKVTLPAGLTSLGAQAFYNCTSLDSIAIPSGVSLLPDKIFYGCSRLSQISLPEDLTGIGGYAFYGCSGLTGIELPQGLTSLGSYAFYGCSGLREIQIPSGIRELPSHIFYRCTSLNSVSLPQGLETVGNYAFYYCGALKEIQIPDTVKTLGEYAFSYSGLEEITLPEGITQVPYSGFRECGSLKKVTLPSTLTVLKGYAFRDCGKLNKVYFYGSAPTLEGSALYGCSASLMLYYIDGSDGWTSPTWNGYNTAKFVPVDEENVASVPVTGGSLQVYLTTGEVIGYEGSPTKIQFPDTVEGVEITKVGDNLFNGCESLQSVVVPEGYTQIGANAFYGCTYLTSADIAGSVETVGMNAFRGCTRLSSVTLREGLNSLGTGAFYGCTDLGSITLPDSLESLSADTFYNCTSLSKVTLPAGLTSLGAQAFYNCTSLGSIAIPSQVTVLPERVFQGCYKLSQVSLPEGLTGIEGYAFYDCSGLTGIELPQGLTSLGNYVFYGCSGLTGIELPQGLTSLGNYAFYGCSGLIEIQIPSGITSLPVDAFSSCTSLSSVSLPEGMETVGNYAFYHCGALTEIQIPDTVKTLGDYAFSYSGLEEITLPEGITQVSYSAFRECGSLKKVTLPSTVTVIKGYAFRDCGKLSAVYFYGPAPTLESSALYNCASSLVLYYIEGKDGWTSPTWNGYNTAKFVPGDDENLVSVEVPGGSLQVYLPTGEVIGYEGEPTQVEFPALMGETKITKVGDGLFSNCASLQSVVVPEGYIQIGANAFNGCANLEQFQMGNSVESIGINAFRDCKKLSAVTLSDGLKELSDGMFYNCSSLSGITLPSGLERIGESAFYCCAALADMTLPTGLTSLGAKVFYNCTSLESVNIPTGVATLPEYAFYGCDKLSQVSLPEGLTGIGEYVFYDCAGLTGIGLPQGLTSLGRSAFSGCGSLAEIQIPSGVRELPSYVFYGCTKLNSVSLPEELETIDNYAFYNCRALTGIELPGTVNTLGSYAFSYSGLEEVTLPEGIPQVPNSAFRDCGSLQRATLPSTVTELGNHAFRDCGKLSAVYFYGPAPTLGSYAPFYNCASSLVLYYIEGTGGWTSPTWNGYNTARFVPADDENLVSVEVPGGSLQVYLITGEVIGYEGEPTQVEFPAQVENVAITKLADSLFSGCESLQSVVVPEGYIQIGANAFNGCANLEQVQMGNSVENMGINAFRNCKKLSQITLSDGLKELSDGLFYNCSSLTGISLPSGLERIGGSAFYGCAALSGVTLPAGLTSLGDRAFYNCTSLESINIPTGVTALPEYVFYGCDKLSQAGLPEGLTEIGNYAFYDCVSLTGIQLPQGLTSLGNSAFHSCGSLTEIQIPSGVRELPSYAFYRCANLNSVSLPEGLETVGNYAFYYCKALRGIELPGTVKTLGSYVFSYSGLEEITLPEGIAQVPYSAFRDCGSLTKVTLPSTVTELGDYAFRDCGNLRAVYFYGPAPILGGSALYNCSSSLVLYYIPGSTRWTSPTWNGYNTAKFVPVDEEKLVSVEVPGGSLQVYLTTGEVIGYEGAPTQVELPVLVENVEITKVGDGLFHGCESLQSVVVPEGYVSVGINAFNGCGNLERVQLGNSVESIGINAFRDCKKLSEVRLPEGLEELSERMFYNCSSLAGISLPSGLKRVGESAFYGCSALSDINLPSGLTSLGSKVFYNCTSLESIAIPAGVAALPEHAFYGCSKLSQVSLPAGLTEIGSSAFYGCSGLGGIELPESLTSLGDYAFYSCSSLTEIQIPSGITVIPYEAFYNCTRLKSVSLPEGLEEIENYTFYNCKALREIKLPGTVRTLGNAAFSSSGLEEITLPEGIAQVPYGAFRNCGSLQRATLPSTVTELGDYAFEDCKNLSAVYFYGPAPTLGGRALYNCASSLVLYYIEGSTRWTSPTWNGYSTETFHTYDGHRYVLVDTPLSWTAARDAAGEAGGMLAVISAREEQEYAQALMEAAGISQCWLGARKMESGWEWIDGTVWNYTGWAEQEPGDGDSLLLDKDQGWKAIHGLEDSQDGGYPYLMEFSDYPAADEEEIQEELDGASIVFDKQTGTLKSVSGTMTSFEIPAEIDGVPVTAVAPGCFGACALLETLSLGEGQDRFLLIDGMLYGKDGKELLSVPRAKSGSVKIAEGTLRIGTRAFTGCGMITEVILPDTVTEIGPLAFGGCTSLKNVKFGSGLKILGASAFRGCSSLTELALPQGLETVSAYAFGDCESLQKVTVPETVKEIEEAAFGYCPALESVYFEGDVPSLANTSLPTQEGLTLYVIPGRYGWSVPRWRQWNTQYYESERFQGYGFFQVTGGSLKYSKETGEILGYTESPTEAMIPSEIDGTKITAIGEGAFAGCETLGTVYVPVSITRIAENAFEGITSLSMYGPTGTQWETYADERGFSYDLCAVYGINPGTASTLGGVADELSVTMSGAIGIPLELVWINGDGETVSIPATDTVSLSGGRTVHRFELDLTDAESGEYMLLIQNRDYGLEREAYYGIDRTPPSMVQNFNVQPGDLQNILTWNMAAEADTASYEIYRKTDTETEYALIASVEGRSETSYTDSDVEEGVEYWYQISAKDQFGQTGELAGPVGSMPEADQAAPRIERVSPENGSVITGAQLFTVTASDNKAVKSITLEYALGQEEEWQAALTAAGEEAEFVLDTTQFEEETIRIRFLAEDIYGNQAYSDVVLEYRIDNQGPEQVKNLACTVTSSTITLSWDDVADEDFSYFQVEQRLEDGTWKEIQKVYTTKGTNITGLLPGQEMVYRVTAYDIYGNRGISSEEITAETEADTTDPRVTGITPEAKRCRGQIGMTFELWDDVGIASLAVQTSSDQTNWFTEREIQVNKQGTKLSVSFTLDTDLYGEGSLYVRGIPVDLYGNEGNSSQTAPFVEYYVDRTAPAVPENLTAEAEGGNVLLSWSQGTEPDLNGYQIIRIEEDSGKYEILASGIKQISYTDQTARFGTQYYYRIQAVDMAGNLSEASPAAAVMMPEDTEPPKVYSVSPSDQYVLGASTQIKALVGDNDQVAFLCAQYSTDGSEWIDLPQVEVNAREGVYALKLTPGNLGSKKLQVKVWCEDRMGNLSETVSRTYEIDVVAPKAPSFKAETAEGGVLLTWETAGEEDLAGFYVYRKSSSTSGYRCILQKSAQAGKSYSFLDEGAEPGERYTYYIEVFDAQGNSSKSSTVSAEGSEEEKADENSPVARITGNTVGETGIEIGFSAAGSWDDQGIVSYQWNFGDGSTSRLMAPSHAYAQEGTYQVTLKVTDGAGNTGTDQISVVVKEPAKVGYVNVRVVDENGSPVPEAGVYFDLGSEDMTVVNTDSQGYAKLASGLGIFPVGAYKTGYLPVKNEVQILENATVTLTLTMVQKDMVVGELNVHRMTLSEIKAAGIDVASEANQNVFKFGIQLIYMGEKLDVEGICNGKGHVLSDPGKFEVGDREVTVKVMSLGLGGFGGTGDSGVSPLIAVIDIPGTASWLKDFFDVRLTILNQADPQFVLDECVATLDVPSGLTLMNTNRTTASPAVSMGSIAGGETAVAEWILRGDTPGTYSLSADFNAILRDFGANVTGQFASQYPVEVRDGQNLYLDIVTESAILEYTDGAIRVGFRNEDENPVYYPKLALENVQLVRSYKTKGLSTVKTDKNVLASGEEIWFDYIIRREDWPALMENPDTTFYLVKQILKKLSGMEMQSTFTTVQPLTIAADKIEIYRYDPETGQAGERLTLLDLKKNGLFSATVPDMLIKTYTQDEEGNDIPKSMDVVIRDGYKMRDGGAPQTVTTDANGEYVLKGYEITDWWPEADDDNNKTNYKAYEIIFHSSRAVTTLPVVARGATASTGRLKVNVLAETGDGGYQRLKGALVTVGSTSGMTGEKGQVTMTGIPTGNATISISAEGYYLFEDVVNVGADTEKTYYLTPDDGSGHSSIKSIRCSLSSNSLGNVVIVPKGRVTGSVTFTLEREMKEGEKFLSYVYRITDKSGKVRDEGTFTSNTFMLSLSDMEADDRLSFAMDLEVPNEGKYRTSYRDSHFLVIKSPNFLNEFAYNLNQWRGETKWKLDGSAALSLFLGNNVSKSSINLGEGLVYTSSDETGNVLLALLRQYSLEVEESGTFPVTAAYEASGKLTITINIAGGSKTVTETSSAGQIIKYNNFLSVKEASSKKKRTTSGAIKVDLEFAYNTVKDIWDLTIYGTMEGSVKVPLGKAEIKVAYATADFQGSGLLKMKLVQTSVGQKYLDELSSFLEFNEGSIAGNIRLAAGGMLGTKDLASIGAYAQVGLKTGFMPNFKILATTEIGWEGNILFLKANDAWFDEDYELYSSSGVSSSRLRVMTRKMTLDAQENETVYKTNTGSGDGQWIGGEDQLASDVYYDAAPQTAQLPDGSTLMVFANYRSEMDADNPIAIYYTRNKDGVWSQPREVVSDGTVGLYPSLTPTENGASLTWMKMNQSLSGIETCSYDEIVERIYGNMSICQAFYDPDSDSWTTREVASDGCVVFSPAWAEDGSGEMTVWIENKANTETATLQNPDTVCYQYVKDGKVADSGEIPISGYDAADVTLTFNGTCYQAAIQTYDEDGAGRLCHASYMGSGWVVAETGADETEELYAPQYAGGYLYYLGEGRILRKEDGRIRQIVCGSLLENVEDMTAASYGENGVVIAWAQDQYGGAIYAVVSEDGVNFSEPFIVASGEGICGAPQITEENGELLLVYQEVVTDEGITYHLRTARIKPGLNLAVESCQTDGILYGGAKLTTMFSAENLGITQADEVKAMIAQNPDGNDPVAVTTVKGLAGSISWTVPEDYAGEDYYLVLLPAEGTDEDLSDNAVSIGNQMRDVAILSSAYMGTDQDGTNLLISLGNEGILSSGDLDLTIQDIQTEEILWDQDVEELFAGDSRDVSVALNRELEGASLLITVNSQYEETDYDNNTDIILLNQEVKIQSSEEEHTHTWDQGTVLVQPGCETPGTICYTCLECEMERQEAIPALGHATVTDSAAGATCTETGLTAGSHCSVCGKVLTAQTVIPALGHKTVTDPAVAPTCTGTGLTAGSHCGICGKVLTAQKTVAAAGHRYNAGVVTKKAACTASGVKTFTCTACSQRKTETIPATGHRYGGWVTTAKATVFAPAKQVRTCAGCGRKETRNYGSKLTPTIKVNVTSIPLKVKQSTNQVKVSGLAAGDSVKSWKSSNTKVVKVNSKGVITAQNKTGKATVTVTLASGKTAKITVKVQKGAVKTTKIGGLKSKVTLAKGKKLTLAPVITPITSKDKVTYSSSNKKIATVSSKGVITAKSAGKAKITVKSGSKKYTVTVTVPKTKTTGIKNVPAKLSLKKGKSYTLKAKTVPAKSDEKLTYQSSNKKVATVTQSGKIKAVKKGTALITVKSGSKKVTCKVTVK